MTDRANRPAPKFPNEFRRAANCFNLLKEYRAEPFLCCGEAAPWNADSGIWRCKRCRRRTSVTKGTIFEGSANRICQWFQALWLVTGVKQGCTARELQQKLGVAYATAYNIRTKIRSLMSDEPLLVGDVDLDVVQLRGEARSNSKLILIALKPRGALFDLGLASPPDSQPASVARAVESMVEKGSTLHTTAWPGFKQLGPRGYHHMVEVPITAVGETMTDQAEKIQKALDHLFVATFHEAVLGLDPYLKEYAFRYNQHLSERNRNLFHVVLRLAAREAV